MGLHNEKLSKYAEAVNYLLTTYASNEAIVQAIRKWESFKNAPGIFAA